MALLENPYVITIHRDAAVFVASELRKRGELGMAKMVLDGYDQATSRGTPSFSLFTQLPSTAAALKEITGQESEMGEEPQGAIVPWTPSC